MARPGGPDVTMMAASAGIDGGSDLDMGLLDGLDATLSHDFGLTSRTLAARCFAARCVAARSFPVLFFALLVPSYCPVCCAGAVAMLTACLCHQARRRRWRGARASALRIFVGSRRETPCPPTLPTVAKRWKDPCAQVRRVVRP